MPSPSSAPIPVVPAAAIDALRSSLLGQVLVPGDAEYERARRVWNGIIDRHPAIIVQCEGLSDVVSIVGFAQEHPLPVTVRGGGHQVAGSAVRDGGLVIDLSRMNGVFVDPLTRTARVQGGARWRHVDRATQVFGLATTGGEVSDTGVAGLTLGGGLGLAQRAFGLACDNLRSIEIVTADGRVRTASATEHADLFWAARGGGRGLGVVTSFEFALHPLGPEVAVGQVAFAYDEAESVLRRWRDRALRAPESVSPELVLWHLPPDPALPRELHGRNVCMNAAVYAGDPADAAPVLEPFATLGTPVVDMSGVQPYLAVQSSFDPLAPAGGRYYFKSHFMDALTDEAIAELLACDRERPASKAIVVIRTMGGAIDRLAPDATAFAHRRARFNLSIDGLWTEPADDALVIGWCRRAWERMRPFATGGVYVNFAGFDGEPDVTATATVGTHAAQLEQVRAAYDPSGLFGAGVRV
jgi:FAD/FMN-containing dehydrogenase